MKKRESLLDTLASRMCCTYLSDLRFLAKWERVLLGSILRSIPPEDADLAEWNDALEYLVGCGPERTQKAARERLLERLKTQAQADDSPSKSEFSC